jgi:hypothetical protein
METTGSSETPVPIYQTALHHIPEDCSLDTNPVGTSSLVYQFMLHSK